MTAGRRRLGAALCTVLLLAGCTGGGTDSSRGGAATGHAARPDPATRQQHEDYGYAAVPDGVDYQPDVVVVGGGASAVRSASSDGLTWAIDRSAPGATRLRLGRVLLMTSVVAGRVVALRDVGATRVVTVAPVLLTDVLRNGTIAVDQPVTELRYQPVPGLAPGVTAPTKEDLPSSLFDNSAVVGPGGGGSLPPTGSSGATIPIGNWKFKPAAGGGKLGVGIEYNAAGLKLYGDVSFSTSNLRFKAGLAVKDGKSTGPSFRIDGITGLAVSLAAGVADSSVDNTKSTITLPGEFDIKIPPLPATAELPLTLSVKYKLAVTTAMTGDNSTLLATGKWKLDGPIGFEGQQPLTPAFSVQQSILDSVHGITLGPSGVVVALNVKAQIGLGPPQLNAGPNAGVTVSIGLTNGSSLGAPVARCKGASLDIDLTYGVGISINIPYEILKYVLPAKTKLNFGIEQKKNLLHREQIVPDVPVCGG